jgi:hypothetical protein
MYCFRRLIMPIAFAVVAASGGGCSDDDDDGAAATTAPVDACVDYKNTMIDKDWECFSSSGFYDDVGYWCAVTRGCADGQAVATGLVNDCVTAIEEASCTEYSSNNYDVEPCDQLWAALDCQPS